MISSLKVLRLVYEISLLVYKNENIEKKFDDNMLSYSKIISFYIYIYIRSPDLGTRNLCTAKAMITIVT